MKEYGSCDLRNIAILAHGKAGKTSLTEALAYNAGHTNRLGKVDDGTTVADFEPEEIITVDRENNESVFNRLESENLNNWLSDYTIGDLWQKNVIKGQP